ncbi:hypothetical protein C7N43_04750 [Sphingobacteriales bacterium UPWRP_1]|nr:hypothetical protein BVG80_07345 [Sphingobacteriales bacterium TSM_CSM]PSJ78243.1 hypothetical protein C7N43_04750 [Sphingobacteriales bacterium UPWRP_1]
MSNPIFSQTYNYFFMETYFFLPQLQEQFNKVSAQSAAHARFVQNYLSGNALSKVADALDWKLSQTMIDEQEHSCFLSEPPVCYDVCVLPVWMHRAAEWFQDKYGGYMLLCSRIIKEHPAFTSDGCKVLVTVVYGLAGTHSWTTIGIISPQNSPYNNSSVIPKDLLSAQERRLLGI